MLLRANSRVINDYKNIYETCFEYFLDSIKASPIMNIENIDNSVRESINTATNLENTFRNSKLILKIVSYLFMHQLSSYTSKYPNMWTRDNHKKILNIVGLTNEATLPIVKIREYMSSIGGLQTLNDLIEEINKNISNEREILYRHVNSHKNIIKEDAEIEDIYRKKEIEEMKNELEKTIKTIRNNIKTMSIKIDEIKIKINKKKKKVTFEPTPKDIITKDTKNISNLYDTFFKNMLNIGKNEDGEYITYLNIWNILLKKNDTQDHTQLISLLLKYINNMNIVKPDIFIDVYDPIIHIYDKILTKYARDYLEMMPYLGKSSGSSYYKNYVLTQIYKIMCHVFKHTMSINFINIITELIIRKENNKDSKNIKELLNIMIYTEFIDECINKIPKKIIRVTCKINEAENEKNEETVIDILNNTLDKLLLNPLILISNNTIAYAKEKIVPFFSIYMEKYTIEMYTFMVKQLKCMIVQGKQLRILQLLADKAILEKSYSM